MIRIILLGRTGNNLFQYALGRVLSCRHQVPLILDASLYNAKGWAEVSHFLGLPIRAKVQRRFSLCARGLNKVLGKTYHELCGSTAVKEHPADLSFDKRILDAPEHCVVRGYFQSPLYFESIAEELRRELSTLFLNHVGNQERNNLQPFAASPHSVAVHVRRGDYLQHRVFQVCGKYYYHSAIQRMRELVPGASFSIFSDDPDWCSREFVGSDISVVQPQTSDQDPLFDLYRMSLASHHIIANSSYSWWAAWLGRKHDQIVICPDRWYRSEIHAPIGEKMCDGWLLQAVS